MGTDIDAQIHMTRLVTWAVTMLGRAFGGAALIAAAIAAGAVLSGEPELAWAGALVAPFVFAGVLYSSSAPLPYDVDERDEERFNATT